jgi:hypothetical protein
VSVFVFLILGFLCDVLSYFKELFVLKVTSKVICLNSFVTCLTYDLTCEGYVFIVSYFPPHHSTGIHVSFFFCLFAFKFIGVLTGKLCIWLVT